MQSRLQKGMMAGLAATAAVSVVDLAAMLIQQMAGQRWFHSFEAILTAMVRQVSGIDIPWIGWVVHFAAGVLILGPLFAVLCPRLPTDTPATKGIVFAVGAWLVMGLTVMPLAGLGVFGAAGGFGTVAWMLATHMLFGVVLGRVYVRMHGEVGHAKRMWSMPA